MYDDFGGLSRDTISAGDTNDHIAAAYQPMDENADDLEYEAIIAIRKLLKLMGEEDDVPTFKRNRIANQREQTDMVIAAKGADLLDKETAISKLPFITPDEVPIIMARLDDEESVRLNNGVDEDDLGNASNA